ncbi:hypothetical protein [Microbacterium sp.]|uniref:hypothetical protein n=1 Tax=Microbacterium sp. TaxID=51671 RepID=UPI0025EBC3C7|nr:hypothetical protein [Microbacterium sp.]
MSTRSSKPTRRRLALPVLLAGSVASLILALGLSPTVAAFTAQIRNTVDTAATGTLIMQETNADGSVICNSTDGGSVSTNAATCATINKYGGNLTMVPGQTVSTDIKIKNTGTAAAKAFSLTPGTCTQSNNGTPNGTATNLCATMTLVVTSGSTTVYSGPLSGFTAKVDILAKTGGSSVAAGATVPFTFAVTLPSSAGNTFAGLQVSQPLTWDFSTDA